MKKIFNKVATFIKDIVRYWKKPKEGDFVPNKEIAYFALGCTGTIIIDAISIGFTAGCFLVGAIYKITFKDIFIIGLLNVPFNLIFQPISMIITDNLGHVPKKTMKWLNAVMIPSIVLGGALMIFSPVSFLENILPAFGKILGWIPFSWSVVQYLNIVFLRKLAPKFGKFRTSVIYGCIPGVISMVLLVYLPFMNYTYPMRLFWLNLLFSMFGTYKGAFTGQRGSLQNVISPKSEERIKINTTMVLLLAPVYGIVLMLAPIFSTLTGGVTSYNTYRILLPIFFAVGVPLTLFMAFGVKDRIVIEKNHVTDISMFAGFKQVLRNKYLWILYISDNIQGIQNGCVAILNIVIIYMLRQDWMLGIITTITGFFGFPGVFLAPLLSKKIGKRNMILLSRFLYYSYFVCALISIRTGSLFILLTGVVLGNLFIQAGYIARDTMNSDMWDYQQFISGKRMESSTGILGTIGSPIVNLLYMVVPTVYLMIGFTNDWNMLYVPHIRDEILYTTIIINVVAHTLGTIPFFFYDLTEKKHREIMKVLEERKLEKEAEQQTNFAQAAAADAEKV